MFIQLEQKGTARYKSVSQMSISSFSFLFICTINILDTFGQFLTAVFIFCWISYNLFNYFFCLWNFSVTNDNCHFKMLSLEYFLNDFPSKFSPDVSLSIIIFFFLLAVYGSKYSKIIWNGHLPMGTWLILKHGMHN